MGDIGHKICFQIGNLNLTPPSFQQQGQGAENSQERDGNKSYEYPSMLSA